MEMSLGKAAQRQQFVFNITVVRGRPFYGFHVGDRIFMKVFVYNPDNSAKVV